MFSKINKNEEISSNLSDHKYNLYQQFFIIGLDPKLMFNINKIDIKTLKEPHISPKIISKYPPKDLYYLNIHDNIIASHCFPHGISSQITDYNESNYESKIKYKRSFVFSLDNQYPEDNKCSLKTNKVYFSCLLFYEDIKNFNDCIEYKKKNSNNNYLDNNLNINEEKNKGLLIPKVICLSSFRPFFEQSRTILECLRKYADNYLYNKISKDNFNIYPIEKIIEGLIYNLPALPRSNFILKINKETFEPNYINKNEKSSFNISKTTNLDKRSSLKSIKYLINSNFINNEIIFYESPFNRQPKNIINYSILMRYFRIREVFEIIKFILLEEPILFFCDDIHLLTYTIEGLVSLIYPFEYQYPVISVLPEQNYSFISIYKHFIFGINDKYTDDFIQKSGISLDEKKYIIIIKIEKRFINILNTDEEDNLTYSVITSIINDNNKQLMKIEMNQFDNYNIEEVNEINENGEIIEKRKLTLPMHYFEKCSKRLEKNTLDKFKEFTYKMRSKGGLSMEEKENIFNNEIRKTFIYFFTCILLRYQSFCVKFNKKVVDDTNVNNPNLSKSNDLLNTALIKNTNYNDIDIDYFYERQKELEEKYLLNTLNINDIFNCKEYIDDTDTPKLDRPFYRQLLQTNLFFNFIKKKIFPISTQDKLDVLFFDNKINEKLGRGSRKMKVDTKYLYEDNEKLSGQIDINSFKKEPSKDLTEILSNKINCNKAINYFQIINHVNNNEMLINKKNNDNNNKALSSQKSEGEIEDTSNLIKKPSKSMKSILKSVKVLKEIECTDTEEKKITFSYYAFPKLLNDDLFFKESDNEYENNIRKSSSLYTRFEKEANLFLQNPIIEQNYKIFSYNLSYELKSKYKYEECISELWLLYLMKTFHSIDLSKKRYYFDLLLMHLNDKEYNIKQDIIILLYNTINKYGDRIMNQELFMFLEKKTYTNFLSFREKTKSENNCIKYMNGIDNSSNNLEFIRNNSIHGGSISRSGTLESQKSSDLLKKKKINKKLFTFIIYSYCTKSTKENDTNKDIKDIKDEYLLNLNENNKENMGDENNEDICGEKLSIVIKDLFDSESNNRYIETLCPKCKKVQNLTVTCFYIDENDTRYQFNFNLISPLALLKEPWFNNMDKINTLYISQEYPEEYLSSIFYFYEQSFPCNFLMPKGVSEQELKEEESCKFNNFDGNFDYEYISKKYRKKRKFISFYSPNFAKRELDYKEKYHDRITHFEFKKEEKTIEDKEDEKEDDKEEDKKSNSPNSSKKSSLINKKLQKLKSIDFNKKKNVTFTCFKNN